MIERLVARFPPAPQLLIGPGDDAAVVVGSDNRVVASTDLLVEGVHFRRSYSSANDVGRKAAAQNLADVAAMGATATALLVGLAAPGSLPVAWAEGLADGLAAEAGRAGAAVAGGDVVASERLTIAVTALGQLSGREPVRRSGARPGDLLVCAGRLGWAAAGLDLLRGGVGDDPAWAALVGAHRCPEVAYGVAVELAVAGATAMIDTSDGLSGDASHLARASKVSLQIDLGALAVDGLLEQAGARLGRAPLDWAVHGGDDHAFLATLPERNWARLESRLRAALRVIGQVVPKGPEWLCWTGGEPPASHSHEHFRGKG